MKKIFVSLILIFGLFVSSQFINIVARADSFTNNTLIYTYYNNLAKYYDNLTGIKNISVNDNYIAYTINDSNIHIINKTTKQVYNLETFDIYFDNIYDITLTKHYLFVHDALGLSAYSLIDYSKKPIFVGSSISPIANYKSYSIAEDNDKIVIACIDDHNFIAYFYATEDLQYKNQYTNTALNAKTETMLNVVTSIDKAYIINDSLTANSNSLWEINYNKTNQFDSSLFPKPNIESLVLHSYGDGTDNLDYLLAIDNRNIIYVLRTDLKYDADTQDIDLADQTRSGNTTDSRFEINDIATPEDITAFDGKLYIADSGTKCIQEFKFEITAESKGSIIGTDIEVCGECGEVGRFNTNSNIDYMDNKLIVSDSTNRRIQIIEDGIVTSFGSNTFSSITIDNLNNLNTAHIAGNFAYFTTYNTNNNQQNIFRYNFETKYLEQISHSVSRILDSAMYGDYIYYVSNNGLHSLKTNSTTSKPTLINSQPYYLGSKIVCSNNTIIVTYERSIDLYTLQGNPINTINISDIIDDVEISNNSLFILNTNNKNINKYAINNNELDLVSTLTLDAEISPYSMTIDDKTGILYLFDNIDCKIVKVINPTFNYLENKGVYQANNKNVCVYDRPYFLNGIDTPNILLKLNVNDIVNIYSQASLSYGNIEYYVIKLSDTQFGYINKNDLTYLSSIVNFEIIHPNATLRSFDNSNEIKIYSEASTDSHIITTTNAGTRVYIVEYCNENFIKVRYYNSEQQIIEGYVVANQVNPDNMTPSQITALILVGISLVLLIAIMIIVRIVYKKRQKKYNK